jgi:hypothetical protein
MKISKELQEMYKFHSWKLKNKEIMDESIGGAIQAAWNRLDPWKTQDTANKVKDIFFKDIGKKRADKADTRDNPPAWLKQMDRKEVPGSGTTGKPGWMEIEDQNEKINKDKEKAAALELKTRQSELSKSFNSGDPNNTRGQIKAQLKDSMLGKLASKIDTYFNPKESKS